MSKPFFCEGYERHNYEYVIKCVSNDYIGHSPAAARSNADTLGAISGPMAYAFYKTMPDELITNAKAKLPEWMLQVNDELDTFVNSGRE